MSTIADVFAEAAAESWDIGDLKEALEAREADRSTQMLSVLHDLKGLLSRLEQSI